MYNISVKIREIIMETNFNSLVRFENNRVVTTTNEIANVFGKEHNKVLRAIKNLQCSEEFKVANFVEHEFQAGKNKYKGYLVTKDGFMFLVMGFTGELAAKYKERFIKAFNKMEKAILKSLRNPDWTTARLKSKEVRKSVADTINKFVQYATEQGSSNANFYYTNITKMEYKLLGFLEDYKINNKNFRDSLSPGDLTLLITMENLVALTLEKGMESNRPYKEIFQETKSIAEEYSNILNRIKPSSNKLLVS
jgi:Rha family phage regulatory protein